jgi:hypothetical protein
MAEEGDEARSQSDEAWVQSLCNQAEEECTDNEQFLSHLEAFEGEQDQHFYLNECDPAKRRWFAQSVLSAPEPWLPNHGVFYVQLARVTEAIIADVNARARPVEDATVPAHPRRSDTGSISIETIKNQLSDWIKSGEVRVHRKPSVLGFASSESEGAFLNLRDLSRCLTKAGFRPVEKKSSLYDEAYVECRLDEEVTDWVNQRRAALRHALKSDSNSAPETEDSKAELILAREKIEELELQLRKRPPARSESASMKRQYNSLLRILGAVCVMHRLHENTTGMTDLVVRKLQSLGDEALEAGNPIEKGPEEKTVREKLRGALAAVKKLNIQDKKR